MALTDWDYLTYSLRVPSPANLNLGDALDLVGGKSFESSRRDILTLFPNDLNNAQIEYLNQSITIIRDRYNFFLHSLYLFLLFLAQFLIKH